MERAHEYDDEAMELWREGGLPGEDHDLMDLVPYYRRTVISMLAAGRPQEAVQILETYPVFTSTSSCPQTSISWR